MTRSIKSSIRWM